MTQFTFPLASSTFPLFFSIKVNTSCSSALSYKLQYLFSKASKAVRFLSSLNFSLEANSSW